MQDYEFPEALAAVQSEMNEIRTSLDLERVLTHPGRSVSRSRASSGKKVSPEEMMPLKTDPGCL